MGVSTYYNTAKYQINFLNNISLWTFKYVYQIDMFLYIFRGFSPMKNMFIKIEWVGKVEPQTWNQPWISTLQFDLTSLEIIYGIIIMLTNWNVVSIWRAKHFSLEIAFPFVDKVCQRRFYSFSMLRIHAWNEQVWFKIFNHEIMTKIHWLESQNSYCWFSRKIGKSEEKICVFQLSVAPWISKIG